MSYSLWPHGLQHTRLHCPAQSPGICSNLCPLNQWCYLTISSSAREGNGNPLQYSLPGKADGQRSLVGCSPWGRKESDMTEWLHFHFSLSCIGEGNGNPLQCPCLRIPDMGEPGGLPSMGSHRVGRDWSDLAAAAASSATPFTFCFQSFPASVSSPVS